MKNILYIVFTFSLAQLGIAQNKPKVIPFKQNNLWGICDSNKTIIVAPEYKAISPLRTNLLYVFKEGKGGVIDSEGKIQIPLNYKGLNFEYDTISWATKNGQELILTLSGQEYIPEITFDKKRWYKEGVCVVVKNKKFGVINSKGKLVAPCVYDSIPYHFNDGRIPVRIGNKWSVLDKYGNLLFEPKYDEISLFTDSSAVFYIKGKGYGVLNQNGEELIPAQYKAISGFREGVTYAKTDKRLVFINKEGEIIYQTKKKYCGYFKEGLAYVGSSWKAIVINTEGKVVCRKFFVSDIDYYSNGLAAIDNWRVKFAYINKKGRRICRYKYDYAGEFSEGLGRVAHGDKEGFIDKSGKVQIPIIYENAYDFEFGLSKAERNNKTFYIDKLGTEYLFE